MLSTQDDQLSTSDQPEVDRLFVAWQDPQSREIRPVGVLSARRSDVGINYDFRYLIDAQRPPFRPFLEFPNLHRAYSSDGLFAMFQNRVMPPRRPDYPAYLDSLGLPGDSTPFTVLAASFGLRATDNVEVFDEPRIDPADGWATCRFLVRGVRHVEGAEEVIRSLDLGERLVVVPEPKNPKDSSALRLETNDGRRAGYVPAYLVDFVHHAAEMSGGFEAIEVTVEGCDPFGPFHMRLLCRMRSAMPTGGFVHPRLQPILGWDHEVRVADQSVG